jgi:hypothetical protein
MSRKFHEILVPSYFLGTRQLLAYVDNVNLLGYKFDTVEKITETLTSYTTACPGKICV